MRRLFVLNSEDVMAEREVHDAAASTGEAGQPVRYTIAPGVSSEITVRTAPGVTCTIRQEQAPDPGHALL